MWLLSTWTTGKQSSSGQGPCHPPSTAALHGTRQKVERWGRRGWNKEEQGGPGRMEMGSLPNRALPHLIILNKSGSLILTVRATFQDT